MADPLSQVFAALADPTRRALVARLTDGDATVGQLAEPYRMSVQAISKHLKVLEQAGLVSRCTERHRRTISDVVREVGPILRQDGYQPTPAPTRFPDAAAVLNATKSADPPTLAT